MKSESTDAAFSFGEKQRRPGHGSTTGVLSKHFYPPVNGKICIICTNTILLTRVLQYRWNICRSGPLSTPLAREVALSYVRMAGGVKEEGGGGEALSASVRA